MKRNLFLIFVSLCIKSWNVQSQSSKTDVTVSSLLNEMYNIHSVYHFPSVSYRALQVSSYDRRSKSPKEEFWFANKDGDSYERFNNLDDIPLRKQFVFDLELLSWTKGTADYSSTSFWYGDYNSKVQTKIYNN